MSFDEKYTVEELPHMRVVRSTEAPVLNCMFASDKISASMKKPMRKAREFFLQRERTRLVRVLGRRAGT